MKRTTLLTLAACLVTACGGDAPPPGETASASADTAALPGSSEPSSEATMPGTLPAVADPSPRTFVFLRHGASGAVDTMGFEHFAREAGVLTGELRSPGGPRTAYRAELTADARVQSVELRGWPAGAPADAEPAEVARGTFRGDSLIGTARQGGVSTATRVGTARGAIPYLSPSVGLMEQVLRRARVLGGDTVQVPIFLLRGAGNTFLGTVVRAGPDSLILSVGGSQGHLIVDGDLRILRGTNPAAGTSFTRIR